MKSIVILAALILGQPQANKPLVDQTKTVLAGQEWNREVVNTLFPGGKVGYRIEVRGPFTLTVLTNRGYQTVLKLIKGEQVKLDRSDVLMMKDFKGPKAEGSITLKAGSHWFMICNNLKTPTKIHLRAWMGGK